MIIIFPFALSSAVILFDFLYFIFSRKRFLRSFLLVIMELFCVGLAPLIYLSFVDFGQINDCCSDSALFSPDHRSSIYILIFLCTIAYFTSRLKDKIISPILDLVINSFLIIGVVLNILIWLHIEVWAGLIGNLPIILLGILQMCDNQIRLTTHLESFEEERLSLVQRVAFKILRFHPILKFPILFILCVPVLIIISLLLLLLGQKPDSMIRAFTDTYKHGLSELDFNCVDVQCGGHYLCTVAAKGHKGFVKPLRVGLRNGELIICNRQLLIANAFEEVIQQKAPAIHKVIRRNYDKVGDFVERYYFIFNYKLISDMVYLLMKPLEWFFLITLYTVDLKPENRIARQYVNKQE